MPTQLRIYTINRGKLNDFVDAWLKGVYPLRQKLGFRIEGAWTIPERSEFVWILSYDGDDWQAREQAYYASTERRTMQPDPAQHIARAEQYFMARVTPEA